MSTPITELVAFTIDCSDASASAHFYAELTGGRVTGEFPEYGYAQASVGPHTLNFQAVQDYAAPQWPTQQRPQQFHLDFRVCDLPEAIAYATGLGARRAEQQPAPEAYCVMLDPDGHPFCLCPPPQD